MFVFRLVFFFEKFFFLTGNYHEALRDAETARKFQSTHPKEVERGNVPYLAVFNDVELVPF